MERSSLISITPSLFVGLGTSGLRSLYYLKSRITEAFGPEGSPRAELLAVDFTEDRSLSKGDYLRMEVLEPELEELWEQYGLPDWKAYSNLRRLPKLEDGAAGVRPLGQLGYRANRSDIRKALRNKAEDVLKRAATLRVRRSETGSSERMELPVWLICSLCGGTGAGALLDAAADLKAESFGFPIRLHGLFFLPNVFRHVEERVFNRIKATADAALEELEYVLDGHEYRAEFEGDEVQVRGLFEKVLLIDGQNEANIVLDTADEEPFKMASDFLFSWLTTDLASRLDTLSEELYLSGPLNTAIGIHRLIHPRARLLEAAKLEKAIGSINELRR